MGGPSYQTPYPVSDQKGGKVIWSWDTKEWSPYTAADAQKAKDQAKADAARVAVGGGESAGDGAPAAAGGDRAASSDVLGGGPNDPSPSGGPSAGMPQQKKRVTSVRRRPGGAVSLPGQSLLAVTD